MKYLPLLLLLTGCSPSFGGGGFLVQVFLGGAAVLTWLRFFGKTPFVKNPAPGVKGRMATFLFAMIWTAATIITYFLMASAK